MKKGFTMGCHEESGSGLIPERVKADLLKEAGNRCAICGATIEEKWLEAGPIISRLRGGRETHENLQIVCSECSLIKSQIDKKAVKTLPLSKTSFGCPFCFPSLEHRIIERVDSAVAIEDGFPVTQGHLLIIPIRHVQDYYDLSKMERDDVDGLIRILRKRIITQDPTVSGFNIGINIGESAGQSIFHAHIHLIPRRNGDTPHPKGGVRGVIPGKRSY